MNASARMAAPAIPIGPATCSDRLALLAGSSSVPIRERVAAHLNTAELTLALLAGDAHASVRLAVARNRRTPFASLLALRTDPCAAVRRHAMAVPAVGHALAA